MPRVLRVLRVLGDRIRGGLGIWGSLLGRGKKVLCGRALGVLRHSLQAANSQGLSDWLFDCATALQP